MKKNKFSKDLLILAILTTITVFTWIGFDVYRALLKTQIPQVLQEQMAPLDPKLDTKAIENLSQKTLFQKEEATMPQATPASETTKSGEIKQ